MLFRTDCRYWRGDKPCRENRLCEGCPSYQPLGPRILLLKVGARGDVLRTTPLVTGLRQHYPQAHITWMTAFESLPLLQDLPGLDQCLAFDWSAILEVQARHFDLVICLDKEPAITGLAESLQAQRKMGWGMALDGTGTIRAFNPEAEYSLALGVSDELKFRQNTKTYPEIIFAAVGLVYHQEPYLFTLKPADQEKSRQFFQKHGLTADRPVLGLFTGCGQAFQKKRWTETGFAYLAEKAYHELKATVLLISGPEEARINKRIRQLARVPLLDTLGQHTIRELAGFLQACRTIVTGDTLVLHLALALQRPTVAIFGPTCSQEISMFGRGEKVKAKLDCSPCYRQTCDHVPDCMQSLSPEEVWDALQRVWELGR